MNKFIQFLKNIWNYAESKDDLTVLLVITALVVDIFNVGMLLIAFIVWEMPADIYTLLRMEVVVLVLNILPALLYMNSKEN